jgi:hypothetical protein
MFQNVKHYIPIAAKNYPDDKAETPPPLSLSCQMKIFSFCNSIPSYNFEPTCLEVVLQKSRKQLVFLPKLVFCAAAQRGKSPGGSHPEPLPYVRVQKWPDQKLKGPASLDGVGQIIVI